MISPHPLVICYNYTKNEQSAVPQHVAHYINKLGAKCHYCGRIMGYCDVLTPHMSTLFQRLIEDRSIRLFWATTAFELNTKPIDYT